MTVPVEIVVPASVQGRLFQVEPFEIPGITAADALDANDAFGAIFTFEVPKRGTIVEALFYDLDDEGINKELWIFRANPLQTLATSDAAFALTDFQLLRAWRVITFSTWKDAANGQLGQTTDTPLWYTAPEGRLWFQFKTTGADNIAAGSMPQLSMLIERYGDA